MKLCEECRGLVGQLLIRTGRHINLTACYERQPIDMDSAGAAVFQYYQCEDCGAVVGRQKAPPAPDAVWQLIAEPAVESEENEYAFEYIHGGGTVVAH